MEEEGRGGKGDWHVWLWGQIDVRWQADATKLLVNTNLPPDVNLTSQSHAFGLFFINIFFVFYSSQSYVFLLAFPFSNSLKEFFFSIYLMTSPFVFLPTLFVHLHFNFLLLDLFIFIHVLIFPHCHRFTFFLSFFPHSFSICFILSNFISVWIRINFSRLRTIILF